MTTNSVSLPDARPVRVRFAPSPTGFLHIGGARTALFNWLYARHTGGTFLLRIEDTDAARNSQEAVEVILTGLRWLGLDWDEGPLTGDASAPGKGAVGPYFQSQRGDRYRERVAWLVANGHAYEHEGAIRFRMPRDPIVIPDLVVGKVTRELTDREKLEPDFVIVRSDGQPVFHLVNVVDDLDMGITHVIRGEDHLSNTAKHIALFRAFGVAPPEYAHIPLILNIDGSKMSKRDKGASLLSYIEEGFAPEAVANYLCLLGWSPKGNREVVSLPEVVSLFDLPQILRHNARFDLKKLHWLNGEYIKTMSGERFHELAVQALQRMGFNTAAFPAAYVKAAVETAKPKVKQFTEVRHFAAFYFRDELEFDTAELRTELLATDRVLLGRLRAAFAAVAAWDAKSSEAALKAVATEAAVKIGLLVHPLRLAVSGSPVGPSLYHALEVLGREKVLQRLDWVLNQAPA